MTIQYIVNGKVIHENKGSIFWNTHILTIKQVAFDCNVSTAQVTVKFIERNEK